LIFVLVTTLAIGGAEIIGGLLANSVALIADAGHMFTDAAGVGLAVVAIGMARRPATARRTFGYLRVEILAAVVNAALLFGVAAFIFLEILRRLTQPEPVASGLMLAVAVLGFVANAVSLWLLHEGQRVSLNVRGAYLEVLGDLAGSAAVIVGALVIALTGWTGADIVASAVIGLLILPRTWRLFREAIDVLLEATPQGIDMDAVRAHILEVPGVGDVHDLHAWTITSGMDVLSAHIVLQDGADPATVLDRLCSSLRDVFDIEHSTFQLESSDRRRLEERAHA
jgi:cobalt-zinc-cadmium efflux system protein